MTPEQQRALAQARARRLRQEAGASNQQGMAGGLFDAFTQGAAFGFGDELTALEGAVLGRTPDGGWFQYDQPFAQRYEQALEAERGQQEQFREENPLAATGAEAAGALATAVATPLGMLGAPVRGAGLAANAVRAGGAGAGMGAVYGYGTGEGGAVERAQSAIAPAGIGGMVGAVAPAVGAGIGRLTQRAMESRPAATAGLSRPSYRMLSDTLSYDTTMGGGVSRLRQAGPDAMVADAGRATADMLVGATGHSGGMQVALPAVQSRATQANVTVNHALDEALGSARGITSTTRGLRQGTAAARSDAYGAAYAQPINYASDVGREIESIVSRRVPRAAIDRANALIRAEGGSTPQILASVADDGSAVFRELPNVRQLDYVTRALNDVAAEADGQGALGGTTNLGRIYGNLSRELRGLMREAVPEYATALDTAAQPIAARNALQTGNRLLSRAITRDDAAEMLSGMSVAERGYVAQGVRAQIDETLANVRRTLTDSNVDARQAVQAVKDLSSDASRDKLRLLLGDEAAGSLFREIDQATIALDLRAAVAQNTKATVKQQFDDTIQAVTQEGPINALRRGEPVNVHRTAWQAVTGASPAGQARVTERMAGELAEALTGPRGQDAIDLVSDILMSGQRSAAVSEEARQLAQMLLMPLRFPAVPVGEQALR